MKQFKDFFKKPTKILTKILMDKLSPHWIEQYLDFISQDISFDNVQKYYDIVRKDWIRKW